MVRLIIDVLATYRLTKLVLDDEITREPREAILDRFNPAETKIGYLFTCPWCVSFWTGLGVFLIRRYAPEDFADILNSTLAASAATGLMYEKI